MKLHTTHDMFNIEHLSSSILNVGNMFKDDYRISMSIDRPKALEFLDHAEKITGRTISDIAKAISASGVSFSHSTLTEFRNGNRPTISYTSLNKVAVFIKYKSYEDYLEKRALGKLLSAKNISLSNIELTEKVLNMETRLDAIGREAGRNRRTNKKPETKPDA